MKFADLLCSVDFVTIANGGHFTGEILGFIGAFKFVESAFAGTAAKGCSRQTIVDNSFSPLALGVNLEPLLVSLLNALVQLGQKDANVRSNVATVSEPFKNSTAS